METKDFSDFGPFRADVRRRALLRDGQPVSLPAKAFDVLLVLLQNPGITVSKDDLLKAVWPDTFVEEGNLTQTIFLLRKALGDSDSQPYIVTVPRQGYRFVGPVTEVGAPAPEPVPPKSLDRRWLVGAAALALIGGFTVFLRYVGREAGSLVDPMRFEISSPGQLSAFAISPDGKRVALSSSYQTASQSEGIWIRDLAGGNARLIPGTENAKLPFWSPDSCCVGFFAHGKLSVVNLAGGPVRVIADAPNGRGGSWSPSGTILFAPAPSGALHEVPASGGQATAVTSVDASRNQNSHRFPWFLPDGRKFLFLAHSPLKEDLRIVLGELGRKEVTPLAQADSNALYVAEAGDRGYLLYLRNRELLSHPFDSGKGAFTGEPRVLARSVEYGAPLKFGSFAASHSILLYREAQEAPRHLRWFSREGEALGEIAEATGVWQIHLARDGSTLAGARIDPETGTGDIWTFDLSRGGANRITRHPAWESLPVLSPDGQEVVFASDRTPRNAFLKKIEGASPERPLITAGSDRQRNPYDWSADGRYILFATFDKNTEDLWVFDSATRREFPLVQTPFNESQGQFSADGKWVAYTSDETGKPEVYVREFLAPDKLGEMRTKVSVDGGTEPRWRQDGKELFYIGPEGALMAVPLQTGSSLRAGKPAVVFRGKLHFGFGWHSTFSYAVTGNGQKFLVVDGGAPAEPSPISVVLNWLRLPK